MRDKGDRLNVLREILAHRELSCQEDLLRELSKFGFQLTQATLSRDLKTLRAVKTVNTKGSYSYILPDNPLYHRTIGNKLSMPRQRSDFRSITFSHNLAIIHTRSGYASGLASEIDEAQVEGISGTIAGDDTILVVMGENVRPEELIEALRPIIPEISAKMDTTNF